MKISAVVLTNNEEKNIIDCLEMLIFCDEIVIIDDNSAVRTIELVGQFKKDYPNISIYKKSLESDFSAQRQFGIDKTKNDWILFIDADERVTPKLASEIKDTLDENIDFGGFLIPRIDFMWGRQLMHGDTGKIKLLRLFNKSKGNLKGKVHETWETKSMVGKLINPIYHYPHPTINEFLKEINFYSDLRARELFDQGKKSGFLSIILYTKGKFIKNYFIKRGFLDGTAGFVHAILMSFHSFLVRGKLWLLWQKSH